MQSASSASPLRPEDEQAINTLAAHFERAFTDAHTWDIPAHATDSEKAEVHRDLIREQILRESGATPSSDSGIRTEEALRTEEPATRTGSRFKRDLRDTYSKVSMAARDKLNAKVRAYGEPLSAMEVEKWLFGEAFGMAHDGAFSGEHGSAAEFASKIEKSFSQEGVETAYTIFRDQAVAGMFGANDLAKVYADLRQGENGRAYATSQQAATVQAEAARGTTTSKLRAQFADAPPAIAYHADVSTEARQLIKDLNGGRKAYR